ncbi:MAG: lipoyl(octanoyl) transferase LipB [Melioribacteraceae bacterium]|nr:lipoyl(octanoyl) transferase LipB [Melioribacteraceae bacterium]
MAKQSIFRNIEYIDLGEISYKQAWDLQKEVFDLRVKKEIGDTFFMLEHPNTYTLGKTASKSNLVGDAEFLEKNKISVFEIDRGGDITYHGPGQIVGYPILDLNDWQKDTHKYLRAIEQLIIDTCSDFGIEAGRNEKYTGVWIENRKIAAIGIKVSRWITMHGFAFNVNTDLGLFNGIIPCGINDKEVTSLQKELGGRIEISEVKAKLLKNFKTVFGYNEATNKHEKRILELIEN